MNNSRSKILIIDDKPANINILSDILGEIYDIFATKSGEAALKIITENNIPDLILLDMRMPGMDGFAVCHELQKNPLTLNVPVIFVTAVEDTKNETLGLEAGAVDYIKRPFTPAIVKSRVKTHLELSQSRLESETRYKALFENMADGIVIQSPDGRILEANEAFCGQTGYSRDELLTMTSRDINGEDDSEKYTLYLKKVISEGKFFFEIHHVRKDGSQFPVEVHARLIQFDGQQTVLAVCRDITERKKVEDSRNLYRKKLENLMAERTAELRKKEKSLLELEKVLDKRKRFQNIVGKSEAMQSIYSRLENLGNVPSTVIITGESGTGKELVAQALHYGGERKKLPFSKIACSDLSENLIESELFGHSRGAFSGAVKDRKGRFEMAGNGTVFLDEIGDIPSNFQKRLLRVLEERKIERVGENKPVSMNARIVAATHHDLYQMVKSGEFREDLYYRLKVITITLPPLRERKEDIPLLVQHFLNLFNGELQKEITGVSSDSMKLLMAYDWPGNIRELKHTLEYAAVTTESNVITPEDLPSDFTVKGKMEKSISDKITNEADILLRTLKNARWNKTRAAKNLGVSRRTLYRKIDKYGLDLTKSESD